MILSMVSFSPCFSYTSIILSLSSACASSLSASRADRRTSRSAKLGSSGASSIGEAGGSMLPATDWGVFDAVEA
jgi:hypothetical protein